ncbi:MAG: DUF934 domain-containing protein [Nannocystaceae bacterium]
MKTYLVRDGIAAEDTWTHVGDGEELPDDGGDAIVAEARWHASRSTFDRYPGRFGVRIAAATRPEPLAADFARFDLIAVEITNFMDGRVFSLGRLLRSRYHWTGELRACGCVLPDQAYFLKRVGFNTLEFDTQQRRKTALRALASFSVRYQGSEDAFALHRYR